MMTSARTAAVACVLLLTGVAPRAVQERSPEDLVPLLRQGGFVLVMRHASSPREAPGKEQANPDNLKLERQLDEPGRRGASAMGEALRRLQIPIGAVLTSPAYRAMETVRLARLDSPQAVSELGDGGQSMQGASEAQARWLRSRVSEAPRSGNTIVVTHQPNLARAFPEWGSSVADGESIVLEPDGRGGFAVMGRIPIDEWPRLRSQTNSGLVTTAVTVRERSGRLVPDLTEHDFVVTEDGRRQTLARFTAERTPLSVAIALDTSQNLRGEALELTRGATRRFIETSLHPDDEVALVSFNHLANVVANWTTDRTRLLAGLDTLAPSGSTALYDAVFKTMSLFTTRGLQRAAIVVISDGADSASDRTPAQIKKELAGTDLFLYWIAVDHADARPATRINPYTIAELAAQANGYSEVIHTAGELDAALRRVSDELDHQYMLSYEPATPPNGRVHSVRVTVPNRNYAVRARRAVLR